MISRSNWFTAPIIEMNSLPTALVKSISSLRDLRVTSLDSNISINANKSLRLLANRDKLSMIILSPFFRLSSIPFKAFLPSILVPVYVSVMIVQFVSL